jgi:hypothetical protein
MDCSGDPPEIYCRSWCCQMCCDLDGDNCLEVIHSIVPMLFPSTNMPAAEINSFIKILLVYIDYYHFHF